MDPFDPYFSEPMGSVDQVMRAAKQPRLPMLGGPQMSSQDIGEVGSPTPPQRPMLPPPPSAVPAPAAPVAPDISGQGDPPVSPSGNAPAVVPSPTPSQAVPSQPVTRPRTPEDAFRARKSQLMTDMAAVMMKGSPAMRVQGLQLLFEVQKDAEKTAEEDAKYQQQQTALTRGQSFIDQTTAGEGDKQNARALLGLGVEPNKLPEVLRLNDAGYKAQQERKDVFQKWLTQQAEHETTLGTMDVAAERAKELIDDGTATTGAGGYVTGFLPFSTSAQLNSTLETLRINIGFDKMLQLKAASSTGSTGLGSVTEKEGQWLQNVQGSLDQYSQDPATLKHNIDAVVAGKKIIADMHALVPGIDAGDPAAIKDFRRLTRELGNNAAQVKTRTKPDTREVPIDPSSSFEKQYGGR